MKLVRGAGGGGASKLGMCQGSRRSGIVVDMCCRLFGVVERLVDLRNRFLDVIALVRSFQQIVGGIRQSVGNDIKGIGTHIGGLRRVAGGVAEPIFS